jgi:hypothetical protein
VDETLTIEPCVSTRCASVAFGSEEHGVEVDRHGSTPLGQGQLLRPAETNTSDVVLHDVEPAERFERRLDRAITCVSVHDHHVRAVRGEGGRAGEPDADDSVRSLAAVAAAEDDRRPPRKPAVAAHLPNVQPGRSTEVCGVPRHGRCPRCDWRDRGWSSLVL